MTYLLDTNVIIELRKPDSRVAPRVRDWAAAQPVESMFISVVTVMEIEVGVTLMERRDSRQGRILREWLENRVLPGFSGRTLSIDAQVARAAGRLHVPDPRPERDAYLAATAGVHELVVATRNVADFDSTGVPTFNPWAA